MATGTHTEMPVPMYSGEDPEMFLGILDATFQAYGLEDSTKQFLLAFGALPTELRTAAKSVLEKDAATRYAELKSIIIEKQRPTESERMRLLLGTTTIGDRKPSEFLQHLRTLIGNKEQHDSPIIKQIFMDQLPSEIKPIVAATKSDKLDDLAETADRVYNITRPPHARNINSVQDANNEHKCTQAPEIASIRLQFTEDLHKIQLAAAKTTLQVKNLETSMTQISESIQALRLEVQRNTYNTHYQNQQQQQPYYPPRGRSNSRGPHNRYRQGEATSPAPRQPQQLNTQTPQHTTASNPNSNTQTLCWYHTTYGNQARSCHTPCAWKVENYNAAQ